MNQASPIIMPMDNDGGKDRPFRLEEKETHFKLTLHGEFDSMQAQTALVERLYDAAQRCNLIEVWISSDGGNAVLMLEIIEALKEFDTVVTVCNASSFSAGALVWSFGDIRVTTENATFGFHRESYGYFGKTDQHDDLLAHQKKVFPRIIEECCKGVLTEDEKEQCRKTEVYITGQEMMERGCAISYPEYKKRDNEAFQSRFVNVGSVFVDSERNELILVDEKGEARHVVGIEQSPYAFKFFDYAVSDHARMRFDDESEFTKHPLEYVTDQYQKFVESYVEDVEKEDENQSEEGVE